MASKGALGGEVMYCRAEGGSVRARSPVAGKVQSEAKKLARGMADRSEVDFGRGSRLVRAADVIVTSRVGGRSAASFQESHRQGEPWA